MTKAISPPEAASLKVVALVAGGRYRQGTPPLGRGAAVRLVLEVLQLAQASGRPRDDLDERVLLEGAELRELDRITTELCQAIGPERLRVLLTAAGVPVQELPATATMAATL